MKRFRLLFCLLFAAVLAFGLGACEADDGYDPYWEGDPRFARRVVITYACPQVVEGMDYHADCPYTIFITDKFNFEFRPTNLPWGDWHSMLSTWIMTLDMVDVAIFNYNEANHADAANFVEQGLIKRLPDDWRERWPNVAGVFSATSLGPALEELYGGVYFLPRARFYHNLPGEPLANHWSLWMRADWIEAVGFEVRNYYTIPEVIEIARRIRDEDPGNLGAALIPISMSYSNSANFFLRANSTHWDTFYRGPDGEYRWGAAAEATWEGLQYWFYAFDNGLLDPEFFVLTHEQDMEKFQNLGIAGVSYLGGQTADMERFRLDFNDFTGHPGEAFLIATLLGASGHYHQRDLINYWGAVFFNPDIDTAVFERWMYLMEWTATPDGYVHTAMGIKGSSWDRDAEGNIVSLVPEGTLMDGPVGVARYPGLGHVMGSIILWDDLAFDNPNIGLSYREESRALYANRYEFGTPETFTLVDWDLWMHDSPVMRRARAINYEQSFANLVATATSLENLEEIYLAWLDSQMSLIQPALDELNAR